MYTLPFSGNYPTDFSTARILNGKHKTTILIFLPFIFSRLVRHELLNVSGRPSVEQPQRGALLQPEEGDEVGRHADDRRSRFPHMQRPSLHRQHHGALQHQLQTTDR